MEDGPGGLKHQIIGALHATQYLRGGFEQWPGMGMLACQPGWQDRGEQVPWQHGPFAPSGRRATAALCVCLGTTAHDGPLETPKRCEAHLLPGPPTAVPLVVVNVIIILVKVLFG